MQRRMSCLATKFLINELHSPNPSIPHRPRSPNSNFSLPSGFRGPSLRFGTCRFSSRSGELRGMGEELKISYISQREAAEIDELLMGPLGFSVDQLMELAGLSVAQSIAELGPTLHQTAHWYANVAVFTNLVQVFHRTVDNNIIRVQYSQIYKSSEYSRVLAICGPGNNGGDGLVAARHLYHFGYKPYICYPKQTPKTLYTGLVTQLQSLLVPFLSVEDLPQDLSTDFDILVDGMFGFSFHGTPRPPFDDLIQRLVSFQGRNQTQRKSPVIASIDIPSGWHVEQGDIDGKGIKPDMLVSLTAPKLCAKKFSGPHHFLGGRFVPRSIVEKFSLRLPPYPGTSMCVRIGKPLQIDISALRENYISPEFIEDQLEADPIDQFHKWFGDAVATGMREPNAMALSTSDKNGRLSSRMVLLKGFDKHGFVWYTNYESRKARELSENPQASLLFHWDCLNRQVRIEGPIQKVSDEESEKYFHSRPRGSQIGAIVSKQSRIIPGRDVLHQEYEELEGKFSDGNVIPKPKHWGGYRLEPKVVEFWQGQPSRLHDRLQYSLEEIDGRQVWHIVRLAP